MRILIYHGPKSEAEDIARASKSFALIIFAHENDEPAASEKIGEVTLFGGGREGKHISTAIFDPDHPNSVEKCSIQALGPEYADDPAVSAILFRYLDRVTSENLLAKVPRAKGSGDGYTGSAACFSCHADAAQAWKGSKHATALKTLVDVKHDRDPDCVSCHVVGFPVTGGFVGHAETPQLENVGCESCHGPGAKHVADPTVKLAASPKSACQNCHVIEHSPRFEFDSYWKQIKH